MKSKINIDEFKIDEFIKSITPLGDSIVAFQDESRVKVHIHTKKPSPVINFAQLFGEFVTFKLENMQLQHNEHVKTAVKEFPAKDLYKLAVTNGDGVKSLYTEIGCDYIIEGGDTMNTSTQEFIEAFELLNSENIVVFPNNKNIVQAALQAVDIYGKKNITVIPTRNIAEGYYALAMDDSSSKNVDFRIKQMKEGSEYVKTILMSTSVRDCTVNDLDIKKDNKVVIAQGELCAASDDYKECIIIALEKIMDEERSALIVFKNKDFTSEMEEELEEAVTEKFPSLNLTFFEGNQSIYELVIGLI